MSSFMVGGGPALFRLAGFLSLAHAFHFPFESAHSLSAGASALQPHPSAYAVAASGSYMTEAAARISLAAAGGGARRGWVSALIMLRAISRLRHGMKRREAGARESVEGLGTVTIARSYCDDAKARFASTNNGTGAK